MVEKIEDKITEMLKNVVDPTFNKNIVDLGHLKKIEVKKGKLSLDIIIRTPDAFMDQIKLDIQNKLASLPEIKKIVVNFISEIERPMEPVGIAQGPRAHEPHLQNVKNIIAVASNKGGVGKSTVASNLALALKELGAKVALLDLDFHGPNIPTMFGVDDRAAYMENNKIAPIIQYGIHIMSAGFIIESKDSPVVLRAPLINQLFMEFLTRVGWKEYDYMVIDMPPGTGDVQLTLAQQLPNTRMVFVTTPQDIALADVNKGVKMFRQEGIDLPTLGIIENMSYFECEHGTKYEIFGSGGAKKVSEMFGIELFGQIPLVPRIREQGDKGKPVIIADPKNKVSQEFIKIARNLTVAIAQNTRNINEERGKKVHIDLDLDLSTPT
jgi:ATP-binding protein involved in chromosome partitioning